MTRAVRAPDRAAAADASVPACPPPITTTSYVLEEVIGMVWRLEVLIDRQAYLVGWSLMVAKPRASVMRVDRTRGL